MIWNDVLLELRAIRIGQELMLKALTGMEANLRQQASLQPQTRGYMEQVLNRRQPRDYKAIIHRDDEAARNRELLNEMGDDTQAMIDYISAEVGPEAAEGLRKFYQEEIVGGRR